MRRPAIRREQEERAAAVDGGARDVGVDGRGGGLVGERNLELAGARGCLSGRGGGTVGGGVGWAVEGGDGLLVGVRKVCAAVLRWLRVEFARSRLLWFEAEQSSDSIHE